MEPEKPFVDLLLETQTLVQFAANVAINHSTKLFLPPRPVWMSPRTPVDYAQQELRLQDVEAVFEASKQHRHILDPNFFDYFIEGERYPTAVLPIRENFISDETFARVLVGQAETLKEVDLLGNKSLGSRSLLDHLSLNKETLPKLTSLSASNQWLFETYENMISDDDSSVLDEHGGWSTSLLIPKAKSTDPQLAGPRSDSFSFTNFFPELSELKLTNIDDFNNAFESRAEFMSRVLAPLRSLRWLELNHWKHLTSMSFLLPLKDTLTTLIIYSCPDLEAGIESIMQLSNLEHLDIAQGRLGNGLFSKPSTTLYRLVSSLPRLKYLDLANTNLCASPTAADDERPERLGNVVTDVYGLNGLHQRLDFLSVFHCENISPHTVLPAQQICSDLTEPHLLTALKTYMDRVELLQIVLNELYQHYRTNAEEAGGSVNYSDGLRLILDALTKHKYNRAVQISGTAALFYIIRSVSMDPPLKRKVVEVMLDAVENFFDETITVRNCCLAFCQCEVPKDVAFAYRRMIQVLVRILNNHSVDATTPRVVTYLLNSMACNVEGENKEKVGVYGAIDAAVDHIRRKALRGVCDEVLDLSWSFLWNVTDETPSNCELFLKAGGIDLFRLCYAEFPERRDLIRNMMGLVGNLAEVDFLRQSLMDESLIKIFLDLLNSLNDGIETSYNSAGVLAQLLSDGEEKWSSGTITREEVAEKIISTTSRWDMNSRRFINYRSFRPILRLLPLFDSPGSQIWALWALANLTTTDGPKYCAFITKEGGLELLHDLKRDSRSSDLLTTLVERILRNIAESNDGVLEPSTDLQ